MRSLNLLAAATAAARQQQQNQERVERTGLLDD
jgi:hypothetical protein